MAWVKAGSPAQFEEMIRKPEAIRNRESVHRRNMETCPSNRVLEQRRWVYDYKPWRIWLMVVSPNKLILSQFANVLGRVVNLCKLTNLWSTLIMDKSLLFLKQVAKQIDITAMRKGPTKRGHFVWPRAGRAVLLAWLCFPNVDLSCHARNVCCPGHTSYDTMLLPQCFLLLLGPESYERLCLYGSFINLSPGFLSNRILRHFRPIPWAIAQTFWIDQFFQNIHQQSLRKSQHILPSMQALIAGRFERFPTLSQSRTDQAWLQATSPPTLP